MNILMIAGVIGPWQLVIVAAVALLFFGGQKIPELMGGLGKGMKEFKKAMREDEPNESPKEEAKKEIKE
jgi:sec-independent protein translocase protein TatA